MIGILSVLAMAIAVATVAILFNVHDVAAEEVYIDVELGKTYSLDMWGASHEDQGIEDLNKYIFSFTPAKTGFLVIDVMTKDDLRVVVNDEHNYEIATSLDEFGYTTDNCTAALNGGEKYTIVADSYLFGIVYNDSKLVFSYYENTEGVKINEENFPDDLFRQYVLDKFDISKDGYLSDQEINAAKTINVGNKNTITTLKGIEFFTELTDLSCFGNKLTSLDLNNLTKLKYLSCGNNDITSLDLSANKELKNLECYGNELKKLDLKNNTKLISLSASTNKISTIDVSMLTLLEKINIGSNAIRSVDLSYNLRLKDIDIGSVNDMSSIDLSIFPDLESFSARYSKLESLDLSKNPKLIRLDFEGSKLCEKVNIKGCRDLYQLYAASSKLSEIDISDCPYLVTAYKCTEGTTTDNEVRYEHPLFYYRLYLDLGVNVIAGDYDPSEDKKDFVQINDVNFPDERFRQRISSSSYDKDENGWFSKEELKRIKEIYVSGQYTGKKISSLKGIEYFTEITLLNCSCNNLKELDLSKNTKLVKIDCHQNYLEKLTLSCPALKELYCQKNDLTSLDLSGSPKLKILHCQRNVTLSNLNISGCNDIEYLACFRNTIKELDLSEKPNLIKAYKEGVKDGVGIVDTDGKTYRGTSYVYKKDSVDYELYVDNGTKIIVLKPTPTPTASPTPMTTPVPNPTAKPTAKPTTSPAQPTKTASVSLALNKKTANVICGKTLTLKATLKGSTDKITWKSSNTKIATVDATGKIKAKMAGEVTITATAAGKSAKCVVTVLYKDVTNSKDFWYAPTNYLTAKGVVKGYDKQTKFKPANKCTRAQMVTFIWRLMGEPAPKTKTCKFSDVKKTDYFYKACIWGNENHIVEGYKDGTFGPQIVCARRHAVTFLWRLANKPKPTSTKNKFKDVKKSDYFYQATLWASEKKILAGYDDGTFRPNGDCLRRQMVTFLYKYDKLINGKG